MQLVITIQVKSKNKSFTSSSTLKTAEAPETTETATTLDILETRAEPDVGNETTSSAGRCLVQFGFRSA